MPPGKLTTKSRTSAMRGGTSTEGWASDGDGEGDKCASRISADRISAADQDPALSDSAAGGSPGGNRAARRGAGPERRRDQGAQGQFLRAQRSDEADQGDPRQGWYPSRCERAGQADPGGRVEDPDDVPGRKPDRRDQGSARGLD